MSSFDRSFGASSPVLALQPQAAFQNQFGMPVRSYTVQSFSHSGAWTERPIIRSTSTFAGRKRSRDEAAINLDEPEKTVPAPSIEEPEDEWEYGPGMVLIKKKTGYVNDASSQSGTWVEEKAAEDRARKTEAAIAVQEQLSQERPSLRSNKSQRLDMTTKLNPGLDMQPNRSSPGRDLADSTADGGAAPIVDDFTLHLGIGWKRVSDDDHIQAAARGWARYIERHYPVTHAKLLLESKGLQSYLVEASEGFFLFGEDLRQGRLVSTNPERALQNLKISPPVFDGLETMTAAGSPKPTDAEPTMTNAAPTQQLTTTAEVDMDMS